MLNLNITRIDGVLRFDFELEAMLNSHGLTVRKNMLSLALEIHGKGRRPAAMTDEHLTEIMLSLCYASNGKDPSRDKVHSTLGLIGERNAYHPVLDYLNRLEWDGEERIDTWLCRFAGADDTPLMRAYSRKILCAAVRRAKKPGCKFDSVLTLQGLQDLGKSLLVKTLCHDPDWWTDQVKVGDAAKETIENTSGAWLVELPELDGLSKREANRVKSFITTVEDRARLSYGRFRVDRPRGFVLFGTTNDAKFLTDTTGNRRWWIVPVKSMDIAGLKAVRDQLWAEAVAAEPDEKLWLDTDDLKADAAAVAREAFDAGPWLELMEGRIPDGPLLVRPSDAWALVGIKRDDIHKTTQQTRELFKKALLGLGFDPQSKVVRRGGEQPDRFYVRGDVQSARMWIPDNGTTNYGHEGPF